MSSEIPLLRWVCKKIARKSILAGSVLAGPLAMLNPSSDERRIRVLTYHRFGEASRDPYSVAPRTFEMQMAHLAKHGLAVSLADLEEFVAGRKTLPENSVLVTIDDGFESVHSIALPILREHLIPAVAFITTSVIEPRGSQGRTHPADLPESYLTWDQIAAMSDGGIAIGSHSLTHRSLGKMSAPEVEEEAFRSLETLRCNVATPVRSFAYPYGTRKDFSAETAEILKRCGYTSVFTSQHGAIRPKMDPFALPRIKVESGEGLWTFTRLTQGGLDAWRFVDQTLWRLQGR